jgi:hypothetical protein
MDAQLQPPLRHSVAILWRGDAAARWDAAPQNSRFVRVFEALAACGIEARPAVYDESFADEVRDQLLAVNGVLIWVDPIHQGKTRAALDPLLREIALQRPWVSAHPDVILKMGVEDVLYGSHLGWGADTHRYDSAKSFRAEFRLACSAPARACSSRTDVTAAMTCGICREGRGLLDERGFAGCSHRLFSSRC